MKLNKIKCVVSDFDNTMYSYGEWANEDILTERFLHEQNLLPGIENKVEYLSKLYPQYHIIQFVFAYLHDNNIDDSAFRKFNNENISEIRKPETVFIKPEIIKEISKKYKLFMISDSFKSYLLYYLDYAKINTDWFDDILQNQYDDEGYTKIPMMKTVLEQTGLKPEEIVMVGDSEKSDILPAKIVGFQTYHVKDVFDTEKFLNRLLEV